MVPGTRPDKPLEWNRSKQRFPLRRAFVVPMVVGVNWAHVLTTDFAVQPSINDVASNLDAFPWEGRQMPVESDTTPPNSRHLTPFSRYFTQIDPDTPQRQEAQIVQSQLDLQDSLP